MANMSGLGSKELWAALDEVNQTFAGYAAAHEHYVTVQQSDGTLGYAVAGVSTTGNAASHSHTINAGHQSILMPAGTVTPLEFEDAKPFIRHVIERMLDLLESEDRWVKGSATAWNHEAKVEQFCLIGALGRAQAELGLSMTGNAELDAARQRVLAAIERFLGQAVQEDKGHNSMPSFNDSAGTTFEEVRLWLKSLFDRL